MTVSIKKSISSIFSRVLWAYGLLALVGCVAGGSNFAPGGTQGVGDGSAAPRMPDIASAPVIDPKLSGFASEMKKTVYCADPDQETVKVKVEAYLLRLDNGWKPCLPGECKTGTVRILSGEEFGTATSLEEVPIGPVNGREGFQAVVVAPRYRPLFFCFPGSSPQALCVPFGIVNLAAGDQALPHLGLPLDDVACGVDPATKDAPALGAD